jgi:hypothetical protein
VKNAFSAAFREPTPPPSPRAWTARMMGGDPLTFRKRYWHLTLPSEHHANLPSMPWASLSFRRKRTAAGSSPLDRHGD